MDAAWTDWVKLGSVSEAFTQPPDKSTSTIAKSGDKPARQINPYVHWAVLGPGEDDIGALEDKSTGKDASFLRLLPPPEVDPKIEEKPWFKSFVGLFDDLPIPSFAAPKPEEGRSNGQVQPPDKKLPIDDQLKVIAGVIDVGMPLGHRSTRLASGNSRILSAWQMLGNYDPKGAVPFGREFFRCEIDGLLRTHSGGQQDGWLDEQAFNKCTSGTNLVENGGPRDLANRASHGAHVLGALAGPYGEGKEETVGIIAINAPSAATFGANGTYLEQFIFHGIKRIVDVADATWKKNNPGWKPKKGKCKEDKDGEVVDKTRNGYPIVINMAFGRQSGSKDILDEFAQAIEDFVDARECSGWAPVHFVMPAGNDNTMRSNAFLEPFPGDSTPLDWRILPQDQSSNFVEVWAPDDPSSGQRAPIELGLAHPAVNVPMKPTPPSSDSYFFSDLVREENILARVYFKRHSKGVGFFGDYRTQFILCVAPTFRLARSRDETRGVKESGTPGLWRITLRNGGTEQLGCVLSVQTDQGLTPTRSINMRSFFEHKNYVRYHENGRIMDSYSYPPDRFGRVINQDILTDTPIRRHGTMLATAATESVARIGGYQISDGRPAFYSSTGRGRKEGQDDGTNLGFDRDDKQKTAPTCSLPTEDSAALFGVLGQGSADGSMVALRGTSFATPQASWILINHLVRDPGSLESSGGILFGLARASEEGRTFPPFAKAPSEMIDVLGSGRIDRPVRPQVSRR